MATLAPTIIKAIIKKEVNTVLNLTELVIETMNATMSAQAMEDIIMNILAKNSRVLLTGWSSHI